MRGSSWSERGGGGAKNIFTYLEMIDNNKELNSLNNGGYD